MHTTITARLTLSVSVFVYGACGLRRARWLDWSGSVFGPFMKTQRHQYGAGQEKETRRPAELFN
jgi:hypothetical protein